MTKLSIHDVKQATAPKPTIRSLLVFPTGMMPGHQTGGGQRSLLFLQVLCALGPTTLVFTNEKQQPPSAEHLPEGAICDHVYFGDGDAPTKQIEPKALRRTVVRIQKWIDWVAPWLGYRHRTQYSRGLARIIANKKPDIVMFRYIDGMMITDHRGSADYVTIVDVDDRPDTKLLNTFALTSRTGIAKRLYKGYLNMAFMARARRLLSHADLVYYSKPADVLDLPPSKAIVRPNVPYFETTTQSQPSQPNLLFVGSGSYAPNQQGVSWFIENCWPELSAQNTDVRLRIVGTGDWPRFGQRYAHLDRIDFVGFVDDLDVEYAQATATICPIFEGAGSQIKLIESCAFARPVICSGFSSTGFGAGIKKHLVIADDKSGFVDGCQSLLTDPANAAKVGQSLQAIQRKHFTRSAFLSDVRTDFQGLIKSPQSHDPISLTQEQFQ